MRIASAISIAMLCLFSHGVFAEEDCGSNLSEVRSIARRKFPQLGTGYISAYQGTWLYSGHQIVIAEGQEFSAMNKAVVICPRADRKFDVLWASGGKAGVLRMVSANQVVVAETSHGDLPFDRAGSMTAGR